MGRRRSQVQWYAEMADGGRMEICDYHFADPAWAPWPQYAAAIRRAVALVRVETPLADPDALRAPAPTEERFLFEPEVATR